MNKATKYTNVKIVLNASPLKQNVLKLKETAKFIGIPSFKEMKAKAKAALYAQRKRGRKGDWSHQGQSVVPQIYSISSINNCIKSIRTFLVAQYTSNLIYIIF